ncbi:MAG: 2-dehydro-3-deoxy-6-phosphogalactonate aldolase [Lentisphaeria bacterium]|nr:2-dehydro-3-deoxy-6-phosphogalactonate aldolase [Lentisphaeria bacterium]
MLHKLFKPLLASKIVVILRGLSPSRAIEVGETLANAGLNFLEIPLNTADALASIEILAKHFKASHIHIGAGTVLSAKEVDAACNAGATYIISPNVNVSVIQRSVELGLLSIPGFQTPTEAFSAIRAGAHILKYFPCDTPQTLSVLKSIIPLPILAVGGICNANKRKWMQIADGLGVGIGIFNPTMDQQELQHSAAMFLENLT